MPEPSPALRVWVTRAQPGAEATAGRLRALGCEPLVAPLIETRPLPFPPPDLVEFGALAFTSAAGVRAFAARCGTPGLPVFAVGAATAAAAHAAGFATVRHADGDGAALARLIAAAPPAGPLLIAGAAEPAFDLPGALAAAGVAAQALSVYATTAVAPPPAEALHALAAGALDVILLHAPSAARALDAAAAPDDRVRVLALSTACVPAAPGWRVAVAAAPRERDLLALLPALDRPAPAR